MTWCAWASAWAVDPRSPSPILSKMDSEMRLGYEVAFFSGQGAVGIVLRLATGDAPVQIAQVPFRLRTHYHVCAVQDVEQGLMRLHVDGQRVGQYPSPQGAVLSPAADFMIGRTLRGQQEDSLSFWGTISDVRVYNRALSDSEIALLLDWCC